MVVGMNLTLAILRYFQGQTVEGEMLKQSSRPSPRDTEKRLYQIIMSQDR